MNYQEFIEAKILKTEKAGFDIDANDVNPILFPHQRDIVKWAVKGGRRAIFASFGLGKTVMQLETCRLIVKKAGGKALIVTELGIRQEFQRDAKNLLQMGELPYVKSNEEINASDSKFFITNYERVLNGSIDPTLFTCVTLDEAAVLRGYGTKTYQTFLPLFANVPYRFVCTATPSPNRYKELIHYAAFLGIMDSGQSLTRFFQRDSTKANNLTIYPHKEKEFWLWVSSWAIFLQKPSDLGYSDDGYAMPELKVFEHCVKLKEAVTPVDSWGQSQMWRDAAVSLKDASAEKRESVEERLEKALEIINASPDDHFLLWHHLEGERDAIEKAKIGGCHTVYGSQDLEEREDLIMGFSDGQYRILATKPEIAGSGCNFQRHCHKAIFLGIDYKFHDIIQAIHRILRFLQDKPVEIHFIYTEGEAHIWKSFMQKWKQHDELTAKMTEIIKEYGLTENAMSEIKRGLGVERVEIKGKFYKVVNNDCVIETAQMKDNSVGMILTSIPFSNHYEYSPNYNDFGHTNDDEHFFAQMDFLIQNLYRVLKPGRIAAIHTKDRVMFGKVTGLGFPTINPFHMKTTMAFTKHGFAYCGMIDITTDVVRENNQTYRLGWSEQCKDGSKMGVGCSEYLLIFRKPPSDLSNAYADEPVTKSKADYPRRRWQLDAHAKWRSSGNRLLTPEELAEADMNFIQKWWKEYKNNNVYDYETHCELGRVLEEKGRLPASFMLFEPSVNTETSWSDVVRMHTLNSKQSKKNLEQHICPFQIDIVERAIDRWSNEGDIIMDPFGGLMTVPMVAVQKNRVGYGIELNPNYFADGCKYVYEAEYKRTTPKLFDLIDYEVAKESKVA